MKISWPVRYLQLGFNNQAPVQVSLEVQWMPQRLRRDDIATGNISKYSHEPFILIECLKLFILWKCKHCSPTCFYLLSFNLSCHWVNTTAFCLVIILTLHGESDFCYHCWKILCLYYLSCVIIAKHVLFDPNYCFRKNRWTPFLVRGYSRSRLWWWVNLKPS